MILPRCGSEVTASSDMAATVSDRTGLEVREAA